MQLGEAAFTLASINFPQTLLFPKLKLVAWCFAGKKSI
jgi:hypothetical protein